jgi:hypothetical protein
VDPSGLGWCKKCGYCRTLESDRKRSPTPLQPAAPGYYQPSGLRQALSAPRTLPSWWWVLVTGIAIVFILTIIPARKLPPEGLARALWCTIQIAVGILMVFAAQFWAVLAIGYADEKVGPRDLFLSARLWGMTLRRLPSTCGQVCLAGWGFSVAVAALVVVGGLGYWNECLPKGGNTSQKKPALPPVYRNWPLDNGS